MEVDESLRKLGFCGRWQATVYSVVLGLVSTYDCWNIMSIIWIGHNPPHHCKIDNNSSESIPFDASGKLSSCSMFINSSNQTTTCLHGWQYDESGSGPTIVSKWDLVCERSYLLQSSQVAFACGLGFGALLIAKLADKFGRRQVLIVTFFYSSVFGILNGLASSIEWFFVYKLLLGFFVGGSLGTKGSYLNESFSMQNRTFYTVFMSSYWGLAASLQAPIAYFIGNWYHLQLFISISQLILVPVLFWIPNTVPWLHANNRIEEAEVVLLRAGKMNNVQFTRPILKPLEQQTVVTEKDEDQENKADVEDIGQGIEVEFRSAKKKKQNHSVQIKQLKRTFTCGSNSKVGTLRTQYSIFELFRNRYLLRHMTFAIVYFSCNVGYYGVSYMSGKLSTNRFLSGFLGTIVEVPACVVAYLAVTRFGKKIPIFICVAVASIAVFACILTVALEEQHSWFSYATLALNVIYKFFNSASYSVIYIYGTEIFPTNLRIQAYGICMFCGRLGLVVASYSSFIINLYPKSLYAFFGGVTLLGGLLILLLPETSNRALPETLEDIAAWYEEDKKENKGLKSPLKPTNVST